MKHVNKSVLLWYSPHEMYELVTAVADYPKFLPWCERAEVLEKLNDGVTAKMQLAYRGVRYAFTTRNRHIPDGSVIVSLVDGPFSELECAWRFIPLGKDARACKIEFTMRYAFPSGTLEAVVSPVFDRIANTFVDSFVRRAEQVYGPR
jgi:ribosome-associated toxin RatA of RatAB toxin-antitoxin module